MNIAITALPGLIAGLKAGAVVVGHILGIISAHDRALALFPRSTAVVGQLPLLLVMVGYTPSDPSAGPVHKAASDWSHLALLRPETSRRCFPGRPRPEAGEEQCRCAPIWGVPLPLLSQHYFRPWERLTGPDVCSCLRIADQPARGAVRQSALLVGPPASWTLPKDRRRVG